MSPDWHEGMKVHVLQDRVKYERDRTFVGKEVRLIEGNYLLPLIFGSRPATFTIDDDYTFMDGVCVYRYKGIERYNFWYIIWLYR